MIQYGSLALSELVFREIRASIELRDRQWIDVELRFQLEGEALPDDLSELAALLFCTYSGEVAQIVPQDEGRDCEYQFTESEKAQLLAYYESEVKPKLLQKAGAVRL